MIRWFQNRFKHHVAAHRPLERIAVAEEARLKVWDVGVRVFHWSLAFSFFVAYFSGDDESRLHVYAGYAVLALVGFRIAWGFIGTKHARFADFIYAPAATLRYVRSVISLKPPHYLGHNPLGGWMIVALLLCLSGACWSGLEVYGKQGKGPLAQVESGLISSAIADEDKREHHGEHRRGKSRAEGEELWKEIHEAFANIAIFLVVLHVAGVLIASALHRENLIRSMITGYKTRREP
jgi:cytochrome b